jgi:hypothetical protein
VILHLFFVTESFRLAEGGELKINDRLSLCLTLCLSMLNLTLCQYYIL